MTKTPPAFIYLNKGTVWYFITSVILHRMYCIYFHSVIQLSQRPFTVLYGSNWQGMVSSGFLINILPPENHYFVVSLNISRTNKLICSQNKIFVFILMNIHCDDKQIRMSFFNVHNLCSIVFRVLSSQSLP